MSECHLCGNEYGSAWSICVRCHAKKFEDDLVKAANLIAEKGKPVGMVRKGCTVNEHNFKIANDDSITCDGCGVKCSGENLAALGFVHRSNINPKPPATPFMERLIDLEHVEGVNNRQMKQVFINPAYAAQCGVIEGQKMCCPLGEVEVRLDVNVAGRQMIPSAFARAYLAEELASICDDGLSFLREPQADGYLIYTRPHSYSIKMTIPEDPTPAKVHERWTVDGNTVAVSKSPAEAPCRTCAKPNDLGVKVCWCCGNAP